MSLMPLKVLVSDEGTFCEINGDLGTKELELKCKCRSGESGGPKLTSQGFDCRNDGNRWYGRPGYNGGRMNK
jgi:hypothetical protein